MQLNLPILPQILSCKNLLIAGLGGGFDIFCGLPLYFELKNMPLNVHLANFSFSDIVSLKNGAIAGWNCGFSLSDTLVGVTAETESLNYYFPELYLSQWFKEIKKETVTIWCFHQTGVVDLMRNYRLLIDHLNIDGIILVDGGVDSLIIGNEKELGTVAEDAISLAAVSEITDIENKFICCLGFGAERDINYAQILENIAKLTNLGGFLGNCSLIPQMPSFQDYENAVLYVQNQPLQECSVINSSVISAVRGNYGNYHLTQKTKGSILSISPLMSLYWFFDFATVVKENLFLSELYSTENILDVLKVLYQFRLKVHKRL